MLILLLIKKTAYKIMYFVSVNKFLTDQKIERKNGLGWSKK